MGQLLQKFEITSYESFQENDSLILPFLNSKNEETSESILTRLFVEHADPICQKIVEFRTKRIFDIDYLERQKLHEDLKQEVRLKMLMQLRKLQNNPQTEPIYDFRNYVARITHNLVHDYFRNKFRSIVIVPNNRVQYSSDSQNDFLETVEAANKEVLPNFAAEYELEEERIYRLRCVWQELCLLPKNQCAAWLLKIEDKNNDSTLKWLPLFRIANIREIAEAIGQEVEILAKYWNYLPLSDKQIAQMLNATQRQVINWRKSANERLQRRIQKLLAGQK
jgi:DNA-directed RNA polymerase specialized sigma24 family protein